MVASRRHSCLGASRSVIGLAGTRLEGRLNLGAYGRTEIGRSPSCARCLPARIAAVNWSAMKQAIPEMFCRQREERQKRRRCCKRGRSFQGCCEFIAHHTFFTLR
jgi:hypothetical protein